MFNASYTEAEKFELFSRPFKAKLPAENFEQLLKIVPVLISKDEANKKREFFLCSVDTGIELIKDFVFDYLYFGPYNNQVLFISRSLFNHNKS